MSGIRDLYGVLKGKVDRFDGESDIFDKNPHVHIYVDVNGTEYKVAVNIRSAPKSPIKINDKIVPNDLLYLADSNFDAKEIDNLQKLELGFYPIKYKNKFIADRSDYPKRVPIDFPNRKYNAKDIAIDFVRSKLFDPCDMKIEKSYIKGDNNDLVDYFHKHIAVDAIENEAVIYVYGGHFRSGKGIHEVHMNQGSIGEFIDSNGVYQDGCILLQYPDGHWEAIFLAFQSQSWDTNNETGNSKSDSFIYDHNNGEKICKINK